MKTHTTLTIDTELLAELRKRGASLSQIFDKAARDWLLHGSESEPKTDNPIYRELIKKWQPKYASSAYFMQLWHDSLVPAILNESEYSELMRIIEGDTA